MWVSINSTRKNCCNIFCLWRISLNVPYLWVPCKNVLHKCNNVGTSILYNITCPYSLLLLMLISKTANLKLSLPTYEQLHIYGRVDLFSRPSSLVLSLIKNKEVVFLFRFTISYYTAYYIGKKEKLLLPYLFIVVTLYCLKAPLKEY